MKRKAKTVYKCSLKGLWGNGGKRAVYLVETILKSMHSFLFCFVFCNTFFHQPLEDPIQMKKQDFSYLQGKKY